MKTIAVVGSLSAIAKSYVRLKAKQGHKFLLFARNFDELKKQKDEALLLGSKEVETHLFDASSPEIARQLQDVLQRNLVDQALICYGQLSDQPKSQSSDEYLGTQLQINCVSVMRIIEILAAYFENKQSGHLAVITSVAGMRGRQSNYIYGACKAALSTQLEGLSHRFSNSPIHVLDIRPGFVDTPMTSAFKKGFLWATPDRVALDIAKAVDAKKQVLFTPFFWRAIMLIICSLPRAIIQKTKL